MTLFTLFTALCGGALIGLSAVVLMVLNGRIAGVSGITAGLLSFSDLAPDRGWRMAFIVGIVAGPLALMFLIGRPNIIFVVPDSSMLLAGFLVGFGTVLGNGCTSGHGICGIARVSWRSIVATAIFMAAGMATTFVVHHMIMEG